MDKSRVAVIAVHGVADQEPGATARAVAELLVSSAPPGVRYASSSTEDLTLRVPPLEPKPSALHPVSRRHDATPRGEDRSLAKAFAQSARSDFQRAEWRAQPTVKGALGGRATNRAAHRGKPASEEGRQAAAEIDRGIAITNYLLTKHCDNGAQPESYETTRIDLERSDRGPDKTVGTADDTRTDVHVYEMYWADLSRLSGAMPRIVSELFTMVFRLSRLGRETVDEAWGRLGCARDPAAPFAGLYKGAWNVVGGLQIALDWAFVNGLALLFTQLALLAIVFASLGFASGMTESWLHRGVAAAIMVLSVLRFVYRYGDDRFWQAVLPIAAFACSAAALSVAPVLLQWMTALALLLAVTGLNEFMLRIADDRFPFVRVVGRGLWAASATLMIVSAVYETATLGAAVSWRDTWVHAALYTTEIVLLGVKWWWILVGLALVVWLVAGLIAAREAGYESRASIATGRLGIAVSFGMFLAVTMTLWAMLEGVLDASVDGVNYRPCVFALEEPEKAASEHLYPPNACLWSTDQADLGGRYLVGMAMPSARAVLDDRYLRSTSTFSLLAFLLVCLLVYMVAMYVPSVLAELKLLVERRREAFQRHVEHARDVGHVNTMQQKRTERARELGRWLTAGYLAVDHVVLGITVFGVLMSLGVATLFFATLFEATGHPGWIATVERLASDSTQALLKPLIFSAAGVGAALSVLGGTLSRRIPSLRGPLDVALDVDNHFREFPRTNIPRAHIFSRYAALLDHVAAQGYERVVIVAHSQGTVISAELLRFLCSRDQCAPRPGDTPNLGPAPKPALPPVSLLTLGCPLRQLYAARFPGLYAWVLANNGHMFGPRAADIGVQRWMNAFCSGDYVGRWLWSRATPFTTLSHPMANVVAHEPFGRRDVYAGFHPAPPGEAHLRDAREVEVCLGLGAHTHYFERDQTTVAWLVDWMIRAAPVGGAQDEPAGQRDVVKVDAEA